MSAHALGAGRWRTPCAAHGSDNGGEPENMTTECSPPAGVPIANETGEWVCVTIGECAGLERLLDRMGPHVPSPSSSARGVLSTSAPPRSSAGAAGDDPCRTICASGPLLLAPNDAVSVGAPEASTSTVLGDASDDMIATSSDAMNDNEKAQTGKRASPLALAVSAQLK